MFKLEIAVDEDIPLQSETTNILISFLVQHTYTQLETIDEPVLCQILGISFERQKKILRMKLDKIDHINLRTIYGKYFGIRHDFLFSRTRSTTRSKYDSTLQIMAKRIQFVKMRGLVLYFQLSAE